MIDNEISCEQLSIVMTEPPDIRYDRDSVIGYAAIHSCHLLPCVIPMTVHLDLV